jgi:hypothetical protein
VRISLRIRIRMQKWFNPLISERNGIDLWKKRGSKISWDCLFKRRICLNRQEPHLKGQCHEIFSPRFLRQSIIPGPQINTLKYFWILFRIRRNIRPLSLIPRYAA